MDRPLSATRRLSRRALLLALGAIVLVGAVVTPAIGRWAATDRTVSLARVRLADVVRGTLVHEVAAQGRVVAASRPTLYAPAAGIVTLAVRAGESVTAGQLLATIDSPELASRVAQESATLAAMQSSEKRQELATKQRAAENDQRAAFASVELGAARRAVARMDELTRLGLVNTIEAEAAQDALAKAELAEKSALANQKLDAEMLTFELEDARQSVKRQESFVGELQRQLRELRIVAPFAGQVAVLQVADRDAVQAGQPVLGVVDLGKLEVEVAIPESFADDALAGAEVIVTVGAVTHPATLAQVSPEVREGAVLGRVAFGGEPPAGLRQNQRLPTRIVLDRRDGVLKVARGAFLESGGGRVAYVVKDGVARKTDIRTGTVSVTEVEVLDGLAEGDAIVVSDLTDFAGASSVLLKR